MNEPIKISLKYGDEYLWANIPSKNILGILYPEDLKAVMDPLGEVRRALREPIGSEPLYQMARGKKNIVIICSDITRPSPSYQLVPPVIEELNKAGVRDEEITIVFALGNHRPHKEEEMKKLVGEYIYQRIKCIDHDPEKCVCLGTSSRGTPIWVFEPVTNADFIICTGNLEFHYFAGYSAGDKALMPGVCGKETIQANHSMLFDPKARSGQLEGNPIRQDIEEIGKLCGVKFIVNAVLNTANEIVKVVAGDPVQAHRDGCQVVDKMYKRSVGCKADIVICSAGGHPKDMNMYQAQKAFENASYAVKEGGIIILAAKCNELLGEKLFNDWMTRAQTLDDPIDWIKEEFILGAHKAAVICKVLKNTKAYLISSMPEELVRKCFFEPAASVDEALQLALQEKGRYAKILVMPFANSTVPHVKENSRVTI